MALPFLVDEDDFFRFRPVQRQVVGSCPSLNIVYLGGARALVVGRYDEVSVVSKFAHFVSRSRSFEVAYALTT